MRFEHENGPGTVVMIGTKRFVMGDEETDPKRIALVRGFPGVREAPKTKLSKSAPPPKEAPAPEPVSEPQPPKEV